MSHTEFEYESVVRERDRLVSRNATLTAELMHYTAGTPHPRVAELEVRETSARRLIREVATGGRVDTKKLMETLWGDAALAWLVEEAEEEAPAFKGEIPHCPSCNCGNAGDRMRQLEAALREVWSDPEVPGQFDEAFISKVDALLASSPETKG